MSGIAIRLEHSAFLSDEVRARQLEAMAKAISHRGPDGMRYEQHGSAGMVQCQLFTTEEDALDHPPLQSPHGERWIVADARIDNRAEIVAACSLAGESLSDAALILHAYERWGDDCAAQLLGDFAFAIWDKKRARLFCGVHGGVHAFVHFAGMTTLRRRTRFKRTHTCRALLFPRCAALY